MRKYRCRVHFVFPFDAFQLWRGVSAVSKFVLASALKQGIDNVARAALAKRLKFVPVDGACDTTCSFDVVCT